MHPVHFTPADDAILVDLRDQSERSRDGILPGAVALDAAAVIARLVPGLSTSLAAAGPDTRWLLVSGNGATAAAIATRLRDRWSAGVLRGRRLPRIVARRHRWYGHRHRFRVLPPRRRAVRRARGVRSRILRR
ncbi:hypothetical protein TPAU25S_02327 [Tsukamurella paurometabola]